MHERDQRQRARRQAGRQGQVAVHLDAVRGRVAQRDPLRQLGVGRHAAFRAHLVEHGTEGLALQVQDPVACMRHACVAFGQQAGVRGAGLDRDAARREAPRDAGCDAPALGIQSDQAHLRQLVGGQHRLPVAWRQGHVDQVRQARRIGVDQAPCTAGQLHLDQRFAVAGMQGAQEQPAAVGRQRQRNAGAQRRATGGFDPLLPAALQDQLREVRFLAAQDGGRAARRGKLGVDDAASVVQDAARAVGADAHQARRALEGVDFFDQGMARHGAVDACKTCVAVLAVFAEHRDQAARAVAHADRRHAAFLRQEQHRAVARPVDPVARLERDQRTGCAAGQRFYVQ